MIEVKGSGKNLRKTATNAGVKAVNEYRFTVEEGRFYTLLGPSGCGKTTTLRCIAGLEKANGGEILVAGQKGFFGSPTNTYVPAYRRPIGMVFQSYAIWPHMTVFENVAFPLRVGKQKVSNADVQKKVTHRSRTGGAWTATKIAWRPSSPAASSSASRWRARWCASPRCCCSTNP